MDGYQADRRRLIGGGVILAGAGLAAACSSKAQSEDTATGSWAPSPEKLDSWLDKAGTRHRMVFDSVSGEGGKDAMFFANNFIHVNEADYGLTPEQLGVVIILRHMSTPYGYNDAMWAKYGKGFAGKMGLKGDDAKRAATVNPMMAKDPGAPVLPGLAWTADATISDLAPKGVRYAVCALATKAIAGMIAGKTGDAAAIEAEFKSSLVPGAVLVPAGISAVNRAQEHGYAFAYTG